MATEDRKMKATGLLTNEVQNGASLARSYDSLGRPTGYTLRASAPPRDVSFSYDALGRLATVASGTNVFAYSYLPGTDLVAGYTCGGFSRSVAYEPHRDLVLAITNRFGSRVISTFEYANDAAGRRTAIKRGGDAMGPLSGAKDAYGYNGRNEVVSARRTLGGESIAGFNEDFSYDPIGNRVSSTDYDETGAARTSTYAANALNQYTSRTVPGWASVRGLADAEAEVSVNGNAAYALASGDLAYFFGSDDFDNSAGGGFADLEVSATVNTSTSDLVSVVTNCVFVPPANEAYAYDADGNQTFVTTGTGAWQVEYNGENRPVKWTRVSPDSSTPTLISMAFDHQGRRRLYVEVAAGVTNKLHRFTYDDYVCIVRNREVEAQHGVGTDAFVWDPTEPIATRPLMCDLSGDGTLFYCHDGNKNVSEAVTPDATIAAHYEYSSFGKVVLMAAERDAKDLTYFNPYRFSSEYADDFAALVYYNYRHYDSMIGRWLGRDLLDSKEIRLLGFVDNNPVDRFDRVGLYGNPVSGGGVSYPNNPDNWGFDGSAYEKCPDGAKVLAVGGDGTLAFYRTDMDDHGEKDCNGCGAKGGMKFPDTYPFGRRTSLVDFTNCCNEHDVCYGTCGSNRHKCDKGLGDCMREKCEESLKYVYHEKAMCNAMANAYEAAVSSSLADGAFEAGQDSGCVWKPCCMQNK